MLYQNSVRCSFTMIYRYHMTSDLKNNIRAHLSLITYIRYRMQLHSFFISFVISHTIFERVSILGLMRCLYQYIQEFLIDAHAITGLATPLDGIPA